MSSIFKKNEHKAPKLNSIIRSSSGRAWKSPSGSATGRFDLATMAISSSSMGSSSSTSYFPLDHRLINTTVDCTSFLMQASGNRDSNESLSISTSTDPGTERHSRETSLNFATSTPFFHDSIRIDNAPAIFISEVDSDATLHKNLEMTESTKYRAIPATRKPPNSPAAIQEGGLASLMSVSMAIMQGGTLNDYFFC